MVLQSVHLLLVQPHPHRSQWKDDGCQHAILKEVKEEEKVALCKITQELH